MHTLKVTLLSYLGFFILSNTCIAQDDSKPSSLLWEITGNNLSSPSYIFGTIHLISKEDFYVRSEIDSVFNLSKMAVFEIKLDDISALMTMQEKMLLPDNLTISGLMSPADYNKLKKYLADSLDVDIADYENKKPLALQQILLTEFIDGDIESYELYFLLKCMQNKKMIAGLETVDEQLGIFDSIPYTEQLQWMVDGIDDTTNMEVLWDELIAAYKSEDLEILSNLIMESSPEIMMYEDLLLINRNKKWIPQIESIIHSGSAFIAIGAGHLPFETGIIQLLIGEGYTLKPL